MAKKEITIPISEAELERIRDGETFDWEFNDVKVHICLEDDN